jgi:hypothetical protein
MSALGLLIFKIPDQEVTAIPLISRLNTPIDDSVPRRHYFGMITPTRRDG